MFAISSVGDLSNCLSVAF